MSGSATPPDAADAGSGVGAPRAGGGARPRGLQARLVAAFALVVVVSTVLTVVVASVTLQRADRERRRDTVARLADTVAEPLAESLPQGGAGTVRVVRAAGQGGRGRLVRGPLRRAVLDAVPGTGDATGSVRFRDRTLVVAARDTSAGRILLVAPDDTGSREGPPLVRTIVLAGVGGLLVALVLGLVLARRIARPVRAVSRAAHRLAGGEPDVAVPVDPSAELGELGRAFNAMAEQLAAARDAERALLSSAGHELRTPLTAVRGYAEAIADGAMDPADAAPIIAAEARRLERLVSDLLELSRMRRPEFTVERGPIDLSDVAAAAIDRHALRAEELGATLRREGDGRAPGTGDAGRALQCVSNLVENALRTVPAGGTVVVRAAPGRLEVADDGPGIPPDLRDRAFERFVLHEALRSDRDDGSGLGLALVAELAARMGGTADVAARPGGGTVFTLALDGRGGAS